MFDLVENQNSHYCPYHIGRNIPYISCSGIGEEFLYYFNYYAIKQN